MGHSSFGPMWPARNPNIVRIEPLPGLTFPGGVHSELAELITLLVRETSRRGYRLVPGWCWGYANRAISGTSVASNHSQGTSIDINAPTNPYSYTFRSDMPSWMPALWKRYGFRWGGDYSRKKDPMHYEFMGTVTNARLFTAQARSEFGKSGGTLPKPAPGSFPGEVRLGSTGAVALAWQRELNARVYGGTPHRLVEDGDFGPASLNVLRDFQARHGLAADGIGGPATWAALRAVAAAPKPAPTPTPTPTPAKDWFDMATKQDLKDAVNEVISDASLMVQVKGDPSGAAFILSKFTGTMTWIDDPATANLWRFLGVGTDDGRPHVLDAALLAGVPVLNRADLEKRLGRPWPY